MNESDWKSKKSNRFFYCDERRVQMTDEKNKVENTFSKKIGKTNYKVAVHFSETSDETITDKINRLIQKECEDMSYKKDE